MTVETLFWNNWIKAREMDRIKMINTLTGFKDKHSHSLYNSYFEDLEEIVRKDERAKCEKIIKEQQEQIDQLLKDDTDYTNKLVEAEKKIKELEKEGK